MLLFILKRLIIAFSKTELDPNDNSGQRFSNLDGSVVLPQDHQTIFRVVIPLPLFKRTSRLANPIRGLLTP